MLQVVALHAHDETGKAANLLVDALALTQPGGCIRLFGDGRDAGDESADLLAVDQGYQRRTVEQTRA